MNEHAFSPTGFAVAWFSCTNFAFVICKKIVVVVVVSSFAVFIICKIGWYHDECTMSAKMTAGLK